MQDRTRIFALLFWNRFIDYVEFSLKKFIKRVSSLTQVGKSILDVGAGQLQYKKYFHHLSYVAQDLGVGDAEWDYSGLDIVSDIYTIPVADASFDYILCAQVMEHLYEPHRAFKEFSRILKPGGLLFVTCPLIWKEHQKPYDFFRYTQYSLREIGNRHNFKIIEINKTGGKFIAIARLINDHTVVSKIPNNIIRFIFIMLLYPFNFIIGFTGYCLDWIDMDKDMTLQYECIFERV